MRNKGKKSAGITLIALVVTIIVLLILAGVAIMLLTGDNGIIKRTVDARNNTIEGEIKEEIALAWNAVGIDGTINRWDNNKKAEELQKELRNKDSSATVTVNNNDLNVKYRGYEVIINVTDGSLNIAKTPNDPITYRAFSVGDKITIGEEMFYVIEDSDENTKSLKLISAFHVQTSTNRQQFEAGKVEFDDSTDVYVNASIKILVDNYKNALQTRWGKTIDQARLLTFEDIEGLGVTVSSDSPWCGNADLSDIPSFIIDSEAYWTGSSDPIYASLTGVNYCPTCVYGNDGVVNR